jgi:mono/diheme cytochrome c family protein
MRRKHLLAGLACGTIALAQEAPTPAQDAPTPIASWSRTAALDETAGSLAERGAAVYNNWCDACHRDSDQNAPGTRSLELKYRGELPAALKERTDLTAELVELYVRNGVATMPFFRKTEISDGDLAALAAYLVVD